MARAVLAGKTACGVLFDIDALGGGLYGQAAYEWFFAAIGPNNRSLLASCLLLDGDTNATLAGDARLYCIAVTSDDPRRIAQVRECVQKKHTGLLGIPYTGGTLEQEPLVFAARFDADANLVWCETPWIMSAWQQISQPPLR